ncbi:MAG: Rieske 2Fe-2S domain-containing protein [Dehalococcoidia bacterium]|nr:Rieske 2Fe-2S domain-containing protein [Dehalococcoidia bacterium]
MAEYVNVGKLSEFPEGQLKAVSVNDEKVGVVNLAGQLHAFSRECTHVGADMMGSDLYGNEILCWLHGSAFNVETGEVVQGPANDPLPLFAIRIEGEDVLVGKA